MLLVLNALKQYENKAPFPLDKKLPKNGMPQNVSKLRTIACIWSKYRVFMKLAWHGDEVSVHCKK